jgi:hypothetical protein
MQVREQLTGGGGLMASNIAQSAVNAAPELQQRVNERFGVLPNFFRLSPETPEITEKLWGFAQAAYLDNPLPSVFKERLFVHVSRFCAVRYCIARHTGFLIGLGRPSGDKDARAESVVDVVKLLRRPLPRGPELASRLSFCSKCPAPLVELPTADTQMEDGLFSLASHVFLQTADAPECLDALERLLGTVRLQYLLLFLAFVRAAHYWTRVHPDIQFEDDIKHLLELAIFRLVQECLTNIHRHSGSKTAVIRITREPNKVYAEVQDHGKGMSQERLAEIQSRGVGVGIRGMRERVRQSHGELTIDSNALGTKITAIFPAKTPAVKEQGTISRHGVA